MSRTVFENPQSCTCGGAPPKKFCQGLKTAPCRFWRHPHLTSANFFAIMLASTREAYAMFADIILLVGITFVAGVVGGLVVAEHFDLEPSERRRRDRRARMLQRKARGM